MESDFNIALHALVYLKHKGVFVRSKDLAQNICTNPARVRKVLSLLQSEGLVETKEGAQGGYRFPTHIDDIPLSAISEALSTEWVGSSWLSGSKEENCLISKGMGLQMKSIYDEMNLLCNQYLTHLTVSGLEKQLLSKGENHEKL